MATSFYEPATAPQEPPRSFHAGAYIKESCPLSARPFVVNFFRLWVICTGIVTLLFIPAAYAESDWLRPLSAFLLFGAMFGW